MISGSWLSYSADEVAHFTEFESTRRGFILCLCGVELDDGFCAEHGESRKCKKCIAKLKKLNRQSGNFEKLRTRFDFLVYTAVS